MGLLDFLLDGKKKKPEAPAAPAPIPLLPKMQPMAPTPLKPFKPIEAKSFTVPEPKQKIKPKVEAVEMNDALDLKGMIPDETLYSGNNEYIKEAAAQRYRQLLHTEYQTPDESGLPSWLQTPLQKAHQYTAAGAGYMGDTIQGALGLMGLSKTSKLREAVLPEQEMRRIESYLEKTDPEMLMELTSEKAISGFSPAANITGQGAAAFAQAYVAAAPLTKVLSAAPALNAIRAGSYGTKGIYAMNVLDNLAGAVSAQYLHGLTREEDVKTISKRIASSPSLLLPFHRNAMLAVGGIADYFAGKYFLGMNDSEALTHSLINLGPNVMRRMSVAGQVRTFEKDMAHVRQVFDGNLEQRGVPKPLRDEVMDSAQRIYAYRKGNPTDFDGVAKLYDQEGSRLQGVFKEYMRTHGVGEQRMIALKGPDGGGNPLLPGNPNVPNGGQDSLDDLIKKYGSEDAIPLNELDKVEYNRVQADNAAINELKAAQQRYEPLGDGTKEGFKNAIKLKSDPGAASRIASSKNQWMQQPPAGKTVTRFVHFDELDDIVKNGAIVPSHHNIAATKKTVAWDTTPDYSAARESGLFNGKPVWKITTAAQNLGQTDDIAYEIGRGVESAAKIPINQLHIEGPGFGSAGAQAPQTSGLSSAIQSFIGPTPTVPTAPGGIGSMLQPQAGSAPQTGATQPQLPLLGGQPSGTQPQSAGKTLQKQLGAGDTDQSGGGGADSLEKIIRTSPTPVNQKVHLLDYLATPENVMKKIGLGKEMTQLRKADEAYRKELPVQIDRVRQWVERTKGKPDASQRIFQYLDGDKTVSLDTNEMGVAKEMQDWFVMWAQRLGLKPEQRFTDYVPHIFDMEAQQEFDEDLAKLIADRVPGEVYNPFLKTRKGMPGFKEDAFLAAEVYAKRATRKVNMDPALDKINRAADGLEEKTFQYVKRYVQEVNLRPVEHDILTDNLIKSTLQNIGIDPYKFGARPTNVLLRGQRQMIYRGLIGGNIGSAIRNLTQGVNTYSELGEKYTTVGYTNLLKELYAGRASQELKDNVVLGMDISQQDRVLSARKKLEQMGDTALFSAFNTAEFINRGAAYYGAKAKYLDEGTKKGLKGDELMTYAIDKAKETVRKTQFQFGPLDAPLVMRGDVMKSALQLQGFTLKQAEFLMNKVNDRDVAGLLRYTAASLAIVATVGKSLGLDSKDFMPGVRFLEDGSLPPGLQLPVGVAGAMFNTPDRYGRVSEDNVLMRILNSDDVQRGAMMYVPGGAQIQKSTGGLDAFFEGEKRSKSGKTQTFPIEQDVENFVRALIYGPYGTKEGRDYIEEEIKGPGLLDSILDGMRSGAGSTTTPKSKFSPGAGTSIPKSKFTAPTR